ncbi:hypothetical protein BDN72DRAFT_87052 [Pluteus cervinus]|uniref:Uncharacterized protein n=1 Tax=Pluteus cervinus TaxID=181527 RepID=A0ACD3AP32_9AGAR|nr:hypothetical protein BDN72DRAFT_87052 [Pluteus cervinus]
MSAPAGGAQNLPPSATAGPFSWIPYALKSPRTVKTWIRCCVVMAATLVLIVNKRTLGTMGQSGFFVALVPVMLPPSLALSLFILAAFILLLGMLVGWAWGAAAMAAGLAVRSQDLLAHQKQVAQASIVQGIPIALQQQEFVFRGMFLDPRTSAVYGAFFFIGTFALGALRARAPQLTLLSIYGTIVLDIMCTTGPLFPTSQYTLAKLFLIPACFYVAIAIASLVLIFPESMNHVWLTQLKTDFFEPLAQITAIQNEALASKPSDHQKWASITESGIEVRKRLIGGVQLLLNQIGLIDLEISVGRLGPSDLKRINKELKSLMFTSTGLHAFHIFVHRTNTTDVREEEIYENAMKNSASPATLDRFTILHRKIREREIKHGHDLDSLVPIVESASADLRKTCEDSVGIASKWFDGCNKGRWTGLFSRQSKGIVEDRHQELVDQLENLQRSLREFKQEKRSQLLRPYEKFFDKDTGRILDNIGRGGDVEMFAVRSLFICFVFADTLDAFTQRLISLFELMIELDQDRPRPSFWFPSGFSKLGHKIMSRRRVDEAVVARALGSSPDLTTINEETEHDPDSEDEDDIQYVNASRKDPDARPPTSAGGKIFLKLCGILRFLGSPEGVFGLRHAIVSVALFVPAVVPSSASFYYENRGIWALIMAQTGLAVYAGDQIAGFVIRFTGTIIGLLVGMAIWYIGAGRGDGNPYGIVIATTFFLSFFLLGRIAAPFPQMFLWTFAGITIIFVIGYSWIDTHFPVLVNSGVGVALGWKRALLVIIGFTAGFIVMMFPRWNSSRRLVRRSLVASIEETSYLLASEVEAFLSEEARTRAGEGKRDEDGGNAAKERRMRKIGQRVTDLSVRLQELRPALATARFEPQVQGLWPHEQYERLYTIQSRLLGAVVLLTGAFARLDSKWCGILVHRTPFLNPNLLSDIFSNLSIISSSLKSGDPLPPSLPRLRDRVVYHERHIGRHDLPSPLQSPRRASVPQKMASEDDDSVDSAADSDTLGLLAGRYDGASIGVSELSLHVLNDDQLPAHSTALVAFSTLISLIDEFSETVKELVGETSFKGFRELQREYIGREERNIDLRPKTG